MRTNILVTSSDNVVFKVETDAKSAPYERAWASSQTAAQLQSHGDFQRINSVNDLAMPEPLVARPRPKLVLIQGGKS